MKNSHHTSWGSGWDSYCRACDQDRDKYIQAKEKYIKEYIKGKMKMTPDDFYEAGFEDGKAGKAMNASMMTDPNYSMGYEDGKGSAAIDKPSSDDYKDFNDPPEGFEYAGVKRVPLPYEFYLSKGGNATFLVRPRKNNQTRHILMCSDCFQYDSRDCHHHPDVKGSK